MPSAAASILADLVLLPNDNSTSNHARVLPVLHEKRRDGFDVVLPEPPSPGCVYSESTTCHPDEEMTAKERIVAILDDQPDDSTYEELVRELVFAQIIDRGLADSDAGRIVSHEEMEARISSWAE